MTEALELKLVARFPTFFRDYKGHPSQTCMAWGMAHGDGWYQLFWELNVEIAVHLDMLKSSGQEVPDFYWAQVKEKFGLARVYYNNGDDVISELVSKYESATATVCEDCGKPGKSTGKSRGWISTLCDGCYKP